MKCTIPEISWHNRDPILSVDVQQNSNETFIRLATAGADYHILIWQVLIDECSKTNLEAISDLTRHQRPVNIVRWSPSGQYLASGDDDANIIIWQLKTDSIPSLDGETNDKETWNVFKIFRGHKEDVYDLCWSPDNLRLVSGSIDNTAIIWNLGKGKNEHIFAESKGFVQGVSWDPKNQYIALLSSDRVCRVADRITKQIKFKSFRGHLPVPESHSLYEKDVKYFHDDTFKSFFRRLSFSPDGNLLVAPSGCIESEDCRRYLNATYIYTMDSLSKPVAVLPLTKQSSIAVRFCPVFFELRSEGPKPFIDLPYRMIFAVATDNDVILYDTQQMTPFAILQKIHYTRLTDLTWSANGTLLIASSTDGFCTIVTFDEGELGLPYTLEESEPEESPLDVPENEKKEKDIERPTAVNVLQVKRKKVEDAKPKKMNLLENWAIKNNYSEKSKEKSSEEIVEEKNRVNIIQPKRTKPESEEASEASKERNREENSKTLNDTECKIVKGKHEGINVLQPRRKKSEEKALSKVPVVEETPEVFKERNAKTLNDNKCVTLERKFERINILQPKRKKSEQKESPEVLVTEETSEALKKRNAEENCITSKEEKFKTINILQPKRKKTEEATSSALIVTDESEKLKETDTEKADKTLNENKSKTVGEKSKTISTPQPKRKKSEETATSELIVIKEASEGVAEEDKTKSKIEGKLKKINILQPKRKHTSSEETPKELKERNTEGAGKSINDNKCTIKTEKSKKINILQPRRKTDKSKKNEVEKKSKEENTENSKPRKSNILEQWTLKKPK
ncbi:chromatin assembly factor 1 subunit B isoform X1 [Agrilus planipennis]|uniref:Chromatin assembly factor 1 subunit B isoform X1 n=1 Tax=Agrilus planipennis TaxID=224129 RepID=A0A1W4WF46_AGRPL|nr:chromatin assembly factor 1 subunit B isoform X1 [Agrilus planipennis]XP_018318626.1 chromatin assembly factor 1 subunit B isoform X1 [Agrilus planipennis]